MEQKANDLIGKALNLANFIEYQKDSIVSKILYKKDKHNVTLFAFDSGQGLSEHNVPFDAILQIIDGEAEIIIGGIPHNLSSGGFIIMPANINHEVKAIKRFKMLLTMIRS